MANKNCLNCGKTLTDKYCSGCGQKADTHRISFKSFIFHDLLHGTFHIEKGILFTAKQALIRPGKAALDYITGKRVSYFNVFLLILLTIGSMLFLRHFYAGFQPEITRDTSDLNEASKFIDNVFAQKSKILILLFVPLAALNSFILFKKKRLNLSEHSIIAGMVLLGILLISTFGHIFFYLDLIFPFSNAFANTISFLIVIITILYVAFGYYNAFSDDYTKMGIFYRILLFFGLLFLELFILLILLIGIATNWEFGEVTVSPFG